MAQLIDASVFIALERRGRQLADLDAALAGEPIALASITAADLLTGVDLANTAERRLRREAFVEAILAQFPVLPFDLPVARTQARLCAQLAAAGRTMGAHDLLIAATAVAYGYAVLTQNVRDFRRVPGLVVRQPRW